MIIYILFIIVKNGILEDADLVSTLECQDNT